MLTQAIKVTGKLVEIEERNGYRTAFILDGRHVIDLAVGKHVNGELDAMLNQNIVAGCIYSTRWLDTNDGRRPAGRLTLVAVENSPGALHAAAGGQELPEAA